MDKSLKTPRALDAAAPACPGDVVGAVQLAPSDAHGREPHARSTTSHGLRQAVLRAGAIFVAVRIGLLALTWAVSYAGSKPLVVTFTKWDSRFFIAIAQYGYPPTIRTSVAYPTNVAFFPLFPLTIRGVHFLSSLGYVGSAALASVLLAGTGAVLVWWWTYERHGIRAADRATALVLCFPGALVLGLAYSESLLLPLTAGALLALRHRNWLLAGVLAALASATNPTGIALLAPCIWACVGALNKERDLRSLAAPLLAPMGVIGYFGYLWAHVGTPLAWFRAEQVGWNEHFDLSAAWDQFSVILKGGWLDPATITKLAALPVVLVLVVCAIRWRAEGIAFVYSAAVLVMALLNRLHSMPRMVWHAFPLLALVGARVRDHWFIVLLVCSAFATSALTVVLLGSNTSVAP